jgi:hypothetical protein
MPNNSLNNSMRRQKSMFVSMSLGPSRFLHVERAASLIAQHCAAPLVSLPSAAMSLTAPSVSSGHEGW